ncbi:ABC transporter permease [Acidobacteriota bacterium]
MFKNYIKVAVRNILKHKGYSLLNIFGLAVGMACCLLILVYIKDELSYDRYHEKADRIFRVIEEVRLEGVGEESSSMPFPAGSTIPMEYPGMVETSVRFFNFQVPNMPMEVGTGGEKRFNESRIFFADAAVFDVFSFDFLEGDPKTALVEPNTIVITEAMAEKYFENENPMGQVIRWQNRVDLRVTGILENIRPNSHFQFDFLGSFATLTQAFGGNLPEGWYWNPCWTYVLLKPGISPDTLQARFPDMVQKYFPDSIKDKVEIKLQALTDIHLFSHLDFEINPNSDISYVYIFSAVAVFVLLIACINFLNLATARSAGRGREAGMRKVLGAFKIQLIRQFFGETMLMCLISATLAVIIVQLALPAFNTFAGKSVSFAFFSDPVLLGGLILIALAVGLLSGIYPAFFLSGFNPVKVLKGNLERGTKGKAFRKILVVVQFSLSIILIIGTIICFRQLNFLRNSQLGFNKDQVLMIPAYSTPIFQWYPQFREQVLQDSHIVNVTALENVLGAQYQTGSFIPEGALEDNMQQIPLLDVTHDFIETFDMEMVAGRSFSREFPTDITEGIIINESSAVRFGWNPQEALGKRLRNQNDLLLSVVGVVKDFNYTSLIYPLSPFVLEIPRRREGLGGRLRYVAVKIRAGDFQETLSFLKTKYEQLVPNRTFDYFFLDEELDKLYAAQEQMGNVFRVFTGMAILIAGLGLFALASFTTELRTREISIRKVLGAKVTGIVVMLSREFAKLVIIANIIAWPAAYLIMRSWLGGFAHRIDLGIGTFVLASVLAFVIAILSVSAQSFKAALAEPVKALRRQ